MYCPHCNEAYSDACMEFGSCGNCGNRVPVETQDAFIALQKKREQAQDEAVKAQEATDLLRLAARNAVRSGIPFADVLKCVMGAVEDLA